MTLFQRLKYDVDLRLKSDIETKLSNCIKELSNSITELSNSITELFNSIKDKKFTV